MDVIHMNDLLGERTAGPPGRRSLQAAVVTSVRLSEQQNTSPNTSYPQIYLKT